MPDSEEKPSGVMGNCGAGRDELDRAAAPTVMVFLELMPTIR
jgi:hypothetical protein